MLRIFVTSFLLMLNFTVQSTLFKYIEVIGIKPNTTLIIVVSLAILKGDVFGAAVGFFAGLMQDIFFGRSIGLYAMIYMLIGYFSGKPFKDFYKEYFFFPLLLAVLCQFIYETSYFTVNFLFQGKSDLFYCFRRIILPSVVYTGVLFVPLYKLLFWIDEKLSLREGERRRSHS